MNVQLIDLNYIQNEIETPIDIKIEILEKYDGNISDRVFISDIRFGINSSIPRGR